MFWPCETRTSTCRNFATISSGLYRFLVITVLLDVKDIPQVGPLQWGRITIAQLITHDIIFADGVDDLTDAVGAIGVVLEKNFENQRVVHCDATLGSSGRAQLSSVARWHLVNVGFDHLECSAQRRRPASSLTMTASRTSRLATFLGLMLHRDISLPKSAPGLLDGFVVGIFHLAHRSVPRLTFGYTLPVNSLRRKLTSGEPLGKRPCTVGL